MYYTLVRPGHSRRCYRCFNERLLAPVVSIAGQLADDLQAFISTTNSEDTGNDEFRERLYAILNQPDGNGVAAGAHLLSRLLQISTKDPHLASLTSEATLHVVRHLKAHQVPPNFILRLASSVARIPEGAQPSAVLTIAEAHHKGIVAVAELIDYIPALLETSYLHDIVSHLAPLAEELIQLSELHMGLIARAFLADIKLDRGVRPPERTMHLIRVIATRQPAVLLPPSTDLLVTLINAAASDDTVAFVCDTLHTIATRLQSAAFVGRCGIELRLSELICVSLGALPIHTATQCLLDLGTLDPRFIDEGQPNELFNRMVNVLQLGANNAQLTANVIGLLEIVIQCQHFGRIRTYYAESLVRFLFRELECENQSTFLPAARLSMRILAADRLPSSTSPKEYASLLTFCVKACGSPEARIDIEDVALCARRIMVDCSTMSRADFSSLIEDLLPKILAEVNHSPTPWKYKEWVLSLVFYASRAARTSGMQTSELSSCIKLTWSFLEDCFYPEERRLYIARLVCCLDPQEECTTVMERIGNIANERLSPAEIYYELLLARVDAAWEAIGHSCGRFHLLEDILDTHYASWGAAHLTKADLVKRILTARPSWAQIVVNAIQTERHILDEIFDQNTASIVFPHLFDILVNHSIDEPDQLSATINDLRIVATRMSKPPDDLHIRCATLARVYQKNPLSSICLLLIRLIELEPDRDVCRRIVMFLARETVFVDQLIASSMSCLVSLELLYVLGPALEPQRATLSWLELRQLWSAVEGRQRGADLVSLVLFETLKSDSTFVVQPQPSIGEFREAWARLIESPNAVLFRSALNLLEPRAPEWMWEQAIFELMARLQAPEEATISKTLTASLLLRCIPYRVFQMAKCDMLATRWLATAKSHLPDDLWNTCCQAIETTIQCNSSSQPERPNQ